MCIYIFICMFCVYVCFLPMFATFTQQPLVTCMRSSDQPSGSQKIPEDKSRASLPHGWCAAVVALLLGQHDNPETCS